MKTLNRFTSKTQNRKGQKVIYSCASYRVIYIKCVNGKPKSGHDLPLKNLFFLVTASWIKYNKSQPIYHINEKLNHWIHSNIFSTHNCNFTDLVHLSSTRTFFSQFWQTLFSKKLRGSLIECSTIFQRLTEQWI